VCLYFRIDLFSIAGLYGFDLPHTALLVITFAEVGYRIVHPVEEPYGRMDGAAE